MMTKNGGLSFYLNNELLCSYDLRNEAPGERKATIELLAAEHYVKPHDIEVRIGVEGEEIPVSTPFRTKLAYKMSVHELVQELRSRSEVIAVQVWQDEDLKASFKDQGGIDDPSPELMAEAASDARGGLEDCEHGWEVLNAAVDNVTRIHGLLNEDREND